MDVTVAICTWNRCALLDQTLAHLHMLQVPNGVTWEVLVVDNNCTDATAAVLAKHADKLPLKHLVETQQGHSHARNKAVSEASGELLLWTDDDVLVHPNWLIELTSAARNYPDAKFFGGPVRPWFERTPPTWITDNLPRLAHCWALLDHGPEIRWLKPGEYAYGANIGFRTDVMRKHPFDPFYGRVGKRLTSGDETRMIDRIRAEGGEGVWVGTAVVDHFLPADRMNPKYVHEVNRWTGYQCVEPFLDDRTPRLFRAPRWMWKRYFASAVKSRLLSVTKSRSWVEAVLDEAKFRGLIQRFREEVRTG